MSTIFRPHIYGGLTGVVTLGGERVSLRITWNGDQIILALADEIPMNVGSSDVLGWLLAQLGGHTVEFSQRLLTASPCLDRAQGLTIEQKFDAGVDPDQVASALKGDGAPTDGVEAKPPTVAGLPIVPAEKRSSRSGSKRKAAASEEAAPQAAPVAPAPTTPEPPAAPAAPPSDGGQAFTAEMADAAKRQEADRSPAEPRFRSDEAQPPQAAPPVEHHVVMDPTPIDKIVDLLTQPPMPPDLNPVDWKRNPADPRYADSAIVRLCFKRYLEPEYMQAGTAPYQPALPAREDMLVDVSTPNGVMALINLLVEADKRAGERGIEIPQVSMWLLTYRDANEVIDLMALHAATWQRLEARKVAEAQRLAALNNQAKPVPTAPSYAHPSAHGQHPAYSPSPAAQQPPSYGAPSPGHYPAPPQGQPPAYPPQHYPQQPPPGYGYPPAGGYPPNSAPPARR